MRLSHPLHDPRPPFAEWLAGINSRRAADALALRLASKNELLPFMRQFVQQDLIISEFLLHLIAAVQNFVQDCEAGHSPRLMIFAPPRHGKALAFGTQVPTLQGMENIENLQPGDFVIGSTGAPIRVVATRRWQNRPRFRVTTDDGHSVIVDANHDWSVVLDRKSNAESVRTTEWLYARQQRLREPRGPRIRLVRVRGQAATLPVQPYTLGAWLGDGSALAPTFAGLEEKQQYVRTRIEAEGYAAPMHAGGKSWGVPGLLASLRAAGVINNKHIPEIYFTASVPQRLALLHGLIDTDGFVAPDGQIEYCSTDEALARGVARLVNSLGVKASVILGRAMLNGVDYGPKYRVMFYMAGAASMPRKAARCRDAKRTPGRYLTFEPVEPGDTCCIEVDSPDHLYLCTDAYILTHNSHVISRALPAFLLGRNPRWEIIAASATQDLADEFGLFARNTLNNPIFQDLFPACAIDPSSNAISRLTTMARGGYRALGVGSQIVGRGANVLIIDDPIASQAHAFSLTERTALQAWYSANARTRLAPGGGIIIMHQRWHPEDLAGTLVTRSNSDPDADQWHVLSYPATSEDPIIDLLGRPIGEALDPYRWPLDALRALKAEMTPSMWAALFQQSPYAEQGNFFKAADIKWYDDAPAARPKGLKWMVAADYATSNKTTADDTAIVAGGLDHEKNLYFHPDLVCEKLEPADAVRRTIAYAKRLNTRVFAHEKGVIANLLAPFFKKEMRDQSHYLVTEAYTRTGAKHEHALALKGMMEQGRVYFPRSKQGLIEPALLRFMPNADGKDDLIDALVSVALTVERAVIAPPPPSKPGDVKKADDLDDDARWEKIMNSGITPSAKSTIRRLNGDPYKEKSGAL